jgi:Mg2+-importing ATPase
MKQSSHSRQAVDDLPRDGFAFWSDPLDTLIERLQSEANGLSALEAEARLQHYGANLLKPRQRSDWWTLLLVSSNADRRFVAAALFFPGNPSTPDHQGIVLSGLLGFWQEKSATDAVSSLLTLVQIKAMVLRDSDAVEIPVERVVPGDIVILNAGDVVPGDGRISRAGSLRG